MNVAMFIVGFVIFSVYIYFTIWNIFTSARKSREENYPYYSRHGQVDNIDMDGHGNYGRFTPKNNPIVKEPKRKKGSQSRQKNYTRKFNEDV